MQIRILVILIGSFLISCSKDNKTSDGNSRNVKYEITGTYSGHLTVVINNNVSGNEIVTVTALPWTKEVTYGSNVSGIGIGGNSVITQPGSPGQTITAKIYSAGTAVKSGVSTANVNGVLSLPNGLSYVFP